MRPSGYRRLAFHKGIGVWGVNSTVVWGYAIASYVWWIAIGSGGTLISSMLLLTRQTLARVDQSLRRDNDAVRGRRSPGLFPILHLGRPQYFYWLAPYPNTMPLWPQWRSALVWDFWAIVSYLLFSILFLYVGLMPDLATMRDRATTARGPTLYGVFALGWRGSARHWRQHETFHMTMAALGRSAGRLGALHRRARFRRKPDAGLAGEIFPPYFVVGAMFSGFAMVVISRR